MRNKATLLIAGPIATAVGVAVFVSMGWLHPSLLTSALAAAVILWSPLPVSLAAVICNTERAEAGAGLGVLEKPFKLYPRMWRNSKSVTEAHLIGFAVLLATLVISFYV